MRISDWSSDVCPSDLGFVEPLAIVPFDRVGSRAQFPAPLETDHVEPHACAEAAPPLRTEFALKIGLALAHGLAIGPEHRDILVLDFACATRIGRQRAARNRRFPVAAPRTGLRDLPLPPARAIDQRDAGCVTRAAAGAGIVVEIGRAPV